MALTESRPLRFFYIAMDWVPHSFAVGYLTLPLTHFFITVAGVSKFIGISPDIQ